MALDSLNRRMLRILCAVCVCPLALRYVPSPPSQYGDYQLDGIV